MIELYHLSQPVKNLRLLEHLPLLFYGSDPAVQITSFTKHHNDVESFLSQEGILEQDNTGMGEGLEHFELVFDIGFATFIPLRNTEFLGDIEGPISSMPAEEDLPK